VEPQGTLYGASSLGGLLKYVTVDPSTDGVSGRVQAGVSDVYNGAQTGHNLRGSVNVPLSETIRRFARARLLDSTRDILTTLEVSALDQATRCQLEDSDGGRLSALWRPSESFSLRLSALLQDVRGMVHPYVYVQPGLGDLQQSALGARGVRQETPGL